MRRNMSLFVIHCCGGSALLLLLVVVGSACRTRTKESPNVAITVEKSLTVARAEVSKLGYDVSRMDARYDKHNTAWNRYMENRPNLLADLPDLKDKLAGQEYWAVYYGPKPRGEQRVFGGDVWVFVSKESGNVLTTLRGK